MDKISWWRTNFGEEEIQQVADSISHECISQGMVTEKFEKEISQLLDIPYVIATTSGSMAILMALMAAGIGHGDEVIVPNRTWIATAHAALLLGAKVVLVDTESERPIMDVTQIEKHLSTRTKAIIPVHLNGRSVNMREVNTIAEKFGLKVIEDAAQAFCSRNGDGFLGCQSFAGCFSLSVAKIISTGQGGFVVTRDKNTYQKLKLMRTHGVSDVINATYTKMGFNFRFTDIQASIGLAQIKRLSDRIKHVKAVYSMYEEAIREIEFLKLIPVNIINGEIPVYVEVLCSDRKGLMKFLASHDIQTRPFYPDLNSAEYLSNDEVFPNAKIFGEQGIFLPCGPNQSLENVKRVIEVLKGWRAKK